MYNPVLIKRVNEGMRFIVVSFGGPKLDIGKPLVNKISRVVFRSPVPTRKPGPVLDPNSRGCQRDPTGLLHRQQVARFVKRLQRKIEDFDKEKTSHQPKTPSSDQVKCADTRILSSTTHKVIKGWVLWFNVSTQEVEARWLSVSLRPA